MSEIRDLWLGRERQRLKDQIAQETLRFQERGHAVFAAEKMARKKVLMDYIDKARTFSNIGPLALVLEVIVGDLM